jgi:tRNA(Ile)-lysidine synthase
MVLLAILRRLAVRERWRLCTAHFNHRLRGRSSDADERLVRTIARRWKIPCAVGRARAGELAAREGVSLEMAAREARHGFLARTAGRRRMRVIALAHQADDQVELFFLRLIRGAGTAGLSGMKWLSPSPADSELTLVRPLLGCTKAELAQFARQEGIPFREDASNASTDVLRNRVRHELLPLLERNYQPALPAVVLRTMAVLGAEAELVAELARAWRGNREQTPFAGLPLAVQRRVLQDALLELGVDVDFDRVELLRSRPGPVTIGPELSLQHDGAGRVEAKRPAARAGFRAGRAVIVLRGAAGAGRFDGLCWQWSAEAVARGDQRRPRFGVGWEWYDADSVGSRVILRHWQAGDRYQPAGMPGPVKLQDQFTNLKIPRARRHQLVVATTVTGAIWWVEGLRIAEAFKLRAGTRRRLRWCWRRAGAAA